jgi:hypothetical protein
MQHCRNGLCAGCQLYLQPKGQAIGDAEICPTLSAAHGFARRLLLDDDFDAAVLRLAHAVGGLHHRPASPRPITVSPRWHDAATAPCCSSPRGLGSPAFACNSSAWSTIVSRSEQLTRRSRAEPAREDAYRRAGHRQLGRPLARWPWQEIDVRGNPHECSNQRALPQCQRGPLVSRL